MTPLSLTLGDQTLALLPEGAVFWPARQTLLVADLHLGKAGVFRRAGVAVPEGDTEQSLARLTALIHRHAVKRLILLGDSVHARPGDDPALIASLQTWRQRHARCVMTAVIGNHDRELAPLAELFEWQIEGETEGGLSLRHHPPDHAVDTPWLAGHWHPVVYLHGGGDRLRLPAFIQAGHAGLVLPAFGGLTGGLPIDRAPDRRRYACAGDQVIDLDRQKKADAEVGQEEERE
ncbi:MAG: ligase-associated DNA damage response endonuclease PdeM [Spiribacter sp.]|nr:ligase-associated DNA damage response endonuclease PdeM [Spiribacter sp.]MDR9454851.1 ligase-associated DNA damage response endonuclease PdeM [Spiribacter sp.]